MDPIKERLKKNPDYEPKYVVKPAFKNHYSRKKKSRDFVSIRTRRIIRQNTRGLCLLCDHYTRRFDVKKRKYVCARHAVPVGG